MITDTCKRPVVYLMHAAISHRIVCESVQEDNPRALASGLSLIQAQNHILSCLMHQHVFARDLALNIGISKRGAKVLNLHL